MTGINEGSAQAFITLFLSMINGEVYKRAFNNETNLLLFKSIRRDFGHEHFIKAIDAAQKHVNYYATLNRGNLSGLQSMINQLKYQRTI